MVAKDNKNTKGNKTMTRTRSQTLKQVGAKDSKENKEITNQLKMQRNEEFDNNNGMKGKLKSIRGMREKDYYESKYRSREQVEREIN